ncbi:hypothetical protein GF380_05230 [Candidatus Uhrbacteria bacterium]|nr:hypothetical protein [Candidatus Uhrbacteria bacterium]MBD3284434.1 hypothetical protein [Candidatus Uhrbacteria bacterium]
MNPIELDDGQLKPVERKLKQAGYTCVHQGFLAMYYDISLRLPVVRIGDYELNHASLEPAEKNARPYRVHLRTFQYADPSERSNEKAQGVGREYHHYFDPDVETPHLCFNQFLTVNRDKHELRLWAKPPPSD